MAYNKKIYPDRIFSIDDAKSFIKNFVLDDDCRFTSSARIRYVPKHLWDDIVVLSKCISDNKLEHVFWIWYNLDSYPKKCLTCGNDIIDFESFNQGYKSNFCSVSCGYRNKDIIERKKQTSRKNYGTDFPCQSRKYQEQMVERYLVAYGVEHPMQYREIFERVLAVTHKKKDYKLPSGKIIKLMGYEPMVVDWLIDNGIHEEQLQFLKIPSFRYEWNDKIKSYFPDIYVANMNLIIEVKSIWTYMVDYKKNVLKKLAVIEADYNFAFVIVHKDKVFWL